MSDLIYLAMEEIEIVWIKTKIKTPPFSEDARIQAGTLLRRIQYGEKLSMPHSEPIPIIGNNCHALRIRDAEKKIFWRIIYHISSEYIVVLNVFGKQRNRISNSEIELSQKRLSQFYELIKRD